MTSGSIWSWELLVQAQGSAPAHLSRAHNLQGVMNNNTSYNICLGSVMGSGTKALKSLRYLSYHVWGMQQNLVHHLLLPAPQTVKLLGTKADSRFPQPVLRKQIQGMQCRGGFNMCDWYSPC